MFQKKNIKNNQTNSDNEYNDLVKKIINNEVFSIDDFKRLQIAYSKTSYYDAYNAGEKINIMFKLLKNNKFEEIIKSSKKILNEKMAKLELHYCVMNAYKELNNEEKYKFHSNIFFGLLHSITNYGDGNTPKTAYHIISVREEYVVLNFFNYKTINQQLFKYNKHLYDKFNVTKDNKNEVIYFNVDIPTTWLSNNFK